MRRSRAPRLSTSPQRPDSRRLAGAEGQLRRAPLRAVGRSSARPPFARRALDVGAGRRAGRGATPRRGHGPLRARRRAAPGRVGCAVGGGPGPLSCSTRRRYGRPGAIRPEPASRPPTTRHRSRSRRSTTTGRPPSPSGVEPRVPAAALRSASPLRSARSNSAAPYEEPPRQCFWLALRRIARDLFLLFVLFVVVSNPS